MNNKNIIILKFVEFILINAFAITIIIILSKVNDDNLNCTEFNNLMDNNIYYIIALSILLGIILLLYMNIFYVIIKRINIEIFFLIQYVILVMDILFIIIGYSIFISTMSILKNQMCNYNDNIVALFILVIYEILINIIMLTINICISDEIYSYQ